MDKAVNMSNRNIDRLRVVRDVLDGKLTQLEAGRALKRSDRQIRRLCAKVEVQGNRGIRHGLCGRSSNNGLDAEVLGQALSALHQPRWEGFGPTFAQEKLAKFHAIKLGVETVRKLMALAGLWTPYRRGVRHRAWRPRRLCVGLLTQLDGSDHDWFEGRGPRCALIIYIDDATSRILYGEFVNVEDTKTLMRTTRTYLQRWGRPVAFYVDKDSIYKINRQASIEEELRDESPTTQFTRAMGELNVEVICAHSPQAKGRVERGFGTHQDRLVKELRLRGIATKEAANRYLWDEYIPEHNARYAVDPASSTDMHKPLLPAHKLEEIMCLRVERTIYQDFVVRFQGRYFQLSAEQPVRLRPKDKLFVDVRLDGSTHLRAKGCELRFKAIEKPPSRRPEVFKPEQWIERPRRRHKPAAGHPWRQGFTRLTTPMRAHLATT